MPGVGAFPEHTPPSTPPRKSAAPKERVYGPAGRADLDDSDSGADELSNNPGFHRKTLERYNKEKEAKAKDTNEPGSKILPENPFETEHSQILFEAIDKLQTWGASKYLEIPQLLIVGGQSSGKSSLLQTLTGIPFQTDAGCCTRWPTRVISRRTSAGEKDKFCVTIEGPEVSVPGILPAEENYKRYEYKGSKLTVKEFERIMNEVSGVLGIRKGSGSGDKNFATEVLKIELSGPNRSYFSILDVPGHFHNDQRVKSGDAKRVENMLIEYMKKPENIVVCVANIGTHLSLQNIPGSLINLYVPDKWQAIGVFTKCDLGENDVGMAQLAVDESFEPTTEIWPKTWFYVRNKLDTDPEDFDLESAESKLFRSYPWTRLQEGYQDHLGSTALKNRLGRILNLKISECFPKLWGKLYEKRAEAIYKRELLGSPRDSLGDQTLFVVGLVGKFKEVADKVLDRPGWYDKPLEMRWQINKLKKEFATFMKSQGAMWRFEGDEQDLLLQDGRLVVPQAYSKIGMIQSPEEFRQEIEAQFGKFQVNQPQGQPNRDLYLKMYQLQVKKWTRIAEVFLEQVRSKVREVIMEILNHVCPVKDGTRRMRDELNPIFTEYFQNAFEVTRKECEKHCKRQANCARIFEEDLEFSNESEKCRKMRKQKAGGSDLERMINAVHDDTKCYYKISLDFFIRGMTTIIEEFVAGEEGPMRWLTPTMIIGLPDETRKALGSEDTFTQKRREELGDEISKLDGALEIVNEATRRTNELERLP